MQKIGEKTIGMAKIPIGMSWAKITWHGKRKRKRKKKKIMTISKYNKSTILLLLKLKDNKLFP